MKLNGAFKPRQGASKQGCSPGVVLRKYRGKRYIKLSENVACGLPFYECGPNNTGQKQNTIKNSQNNKNINRQPQQTPSIQSKRQEKECDEISKANGSASNYNNSSDSGNGISSLRSDLINTFINKATGHRITTLARTIQTKYFSPFHINSNRENSDKILPSETVAERFARISPKEENQTNRNNITTRQVKNTKRNKYYNNNNSNYNRNNNENKSEKEITEIKEVQAVKTATNFSKHHVNVNKTYINNNNNNNYLNNATNIIYYKEQQQQQQQQVVNKFLSIRKLYENPILCALISSAAIILRSFIQFKLLLFFMYSHAIKQLTRGYVIDRSGRNGITNCSSGKYYCVAVLFCKSFEKAMYGHRLENMMRDPKSLKEPFERICFKNANKARLKPSIALWITLCAVIAISLPQPAVGDDGDNFFPINGIETTTPEFDYASRGQKKFGDKCENTLECGFPGSVCDPKKKSCQCTEDLPVTNHIDKCGKEAAVNESCFFNEQCEVKYFQTECRDQRCVCRFDMTPVWLKDGSVECKGRGDKKGPETYIDPAMIGVLIGMALMFIIICVVLRLFSQARWRENRTIFNTPNPRLMNVSLLRESKLLHGQERRGSRMSVRVPSRQPSMASLRPHSPNPSLGKTGRMTRSKSNTRSSDSRVSDASNCSRLLEHHNTANVHHASHTHANATTNSHSNHGPYASASVSPLSINAPTTTISYASQTPAAATTTACSTNLSTPPPTSSRSNSHGSNASATSLRSTRSNSVSPAGIAVNNSHHERKGSTYQPHHHHHTPQPTTQLQQQQEQQPLTQTNIISNPVAETVTVEIIEPEK